LPLPPIAEQRRIVDRVRFESHNIDATIGRTKREIDLLREYHIRLIADVVTGKLDVRGVKIPPLDETEALDALDIDEDLEAEEMDHSEEIEMVAQEGEA
jgi:hypothetical protein